jgi:hypothetical protein
VSVDTGASYVWSGYHEWTKQAARGVPPLRSLSSAAGDIRDSAILLENNYVALHDVRKVTNVAAEPPASKSWGGNFAMYIQHKAEGRCGTFGTLTGGIRSQLEVTQDRAGAPIADACAAYFGLYNNGIDVGGFGLHIDAYHVGGEIHGHSTYGMSAECWRQSLAGRMAAYVGRAQEGSLDYGITLLHSGSGSFKRGIQFGNPTYGLGGIQGAPGDLTKFDVGIDMTHGKYSSRAALMLKADDQVVLSGVPQAQDWAIVNVCNLRFEGVTGMFAIRNAELARFDVNMTTGSIWQNGQQTWSGFDGSVRWAFAVGSGKTTSEIITTSPARYLRVKVDGEEFLMPLYRP